jgi:hypothetical protein
MGTVYSINKGINQPITFQGLKAQYIAYLAIGLVALLITYAVLYICGVNTWVCLILVGGLGTALVTIIFRFSKKYGQYGLLKRQARRQLPVYLRIRSRKVFINLKRV